MQSELTDDEILALLADSQTFERGFRLLVLQYQERIYWHIRRMVLEHEDANDVVQNCFVKVYRNIGKFQQKSTLYTWLYRIATNEAITFLNKKKRKMTSSIDAEESMLSNQLKADPFFDGDEVELKLQKALQQLPKKQLAVFNLRYYDEMSYKEMSEVLSTSVGALKASYHHAVKKIEYYLKNG
ncbi:MAG: DNA-directed RNA polymerase sigma-70 factor [Saprospiraceae bacterium]|nr:MAG: DNA-directed RNA polymerase sigma-70 factor [Saprospiraceae bacterium]